MAGCKRTPNRSWRSTPLALSANAAALLLSWGAPLVLLHVCDMIAQTTPSRESSRTLDVLDAFGGRGEVSTAAGEAGLNHNYFDIESMGDAGNILEWVGFINILRMVLQLRPKGLLMGGPPCGSWIWVNRSTSRRSRTRIFGSSARSYVKEANAITCRWILLAMVAICRGCEVLTEQPSSSLMLEFPYMKWLAVMISPISWSLVRFQMAAYGHANSKPTVLFGTSPYTQKFKKKPTARDKRRVQKNKLIKEYQMVKKTINKETGKVQVTGSKGMKASAAYPRGFAKALIRYHKDHMAHGSYKRPVVQSSGTPPKAPHRWRHALLADLRNHVKSAIEDGSYVPLLKGGLD